MRRVLLLAAAGALALNAAPRKVDPTFLRQHLPSVAARQMDVSTDTCLYKPVFGEGDSETSIVRGVARFGEITVSPGGSCNAVTYPAEEQVYVIMEGGGRLLYGDETAPVKKYDFMYLPAGIRHGISNPGAAPLRLIVMGFRIAEGTPPPPKLQIANLSEVPKQTVAGHPDTVLYQLMMGSTTSTRDRIAAGHLLTSLYVMEFKPGGTNFPHHHDSEEEIYLLLDGEGQMVAGGGMDGIEGRHPVKPGDAFFFRLNCTVGFYNGENPSRILAVRSLYPRRRP
ncbi:MAG: cupin domain-containing protein [Rhodospirillales bacterium]